MSSNSDTNNSAPARGNVNPKSLPKQVKDAVQAANDAERAREFRCPASAPGEFIALGFNQRLRIQPHVLLHALDLPAFFKFQLRLSGEDARRVQQQFEVDETVSRVVSYLYLERCAPLSED